MRKEMATLLEEELLQEKAANLGRLENRLTRALEALGDGDFASVSEHAREALLTDAAEALFHYVVQREVMGLRGTRAVLDELAVPSQVRLRMAPRSIQRRHRTPLEP